MWNPSHNHCGYYIRFIEIEFHNVEEAYEHKEIKCSVESEEFFSDHDWIGEILDVLLFPDFVNDSQFEDCEINEE